MQNNKVWSLNSGNLQYFNRQYFQLSWLLLLLFFTIIICIDFI